MFYMSEDDRQRSFQMPFMRTIQSVPFVLQVSCAGCPCNPDLCHPDCALRSSVHEIHPSHAFSAIPDRKPPPLLSINMEEQCEQLLGPGGIYRDAHSCARSLSDEAPWSPW